MAARLSPWNRHLHMSINGAALSQIRIRTAAQTCNRVGLKRYDVLAGTPEQITI